jgi:signal transduction histidine kinase
VNSEVTLEKRIALLERKISREKRARQQAEDQLEKYSLEIYQTHQSLQRSLIFAKKKQAELSFLAEASANVGSSLSIKELLENTIALTGEFFAAQVGLYLFSESTKSVNEHHIWTKNDAQIDQDLLIGYVQSHLPSFESEYAPDTWLISDVEPQQWVEAKWMVYTHFSLLKEQSAWIVFFSNAEYLDEESLYVLDTARGHLLSGVKRQLNDIRIMRRTVELQDTIESLDKAKRQLVQSEKMASLGQLAAGVAHEINNPIAYISSNLEILGEYIQDIGQFKRRLMQTLRDKGTIDNEQLERLTAETDIDYLVEDSHDLLLANIEGVNRVKEIVLGLKTFSHSGEENFVLLSINECIENALKVAWNALKYEHKIDKHLPAHLPAVTGNSGQLQQVFINLFVNAAQAMENGGILKIIGQSTKHHVVIFVSDTGAGMSEETLGKLFTPFFTSKAVGVGTGLGLSVSYSILEAHGADVEVTSKLGEGSCFKITFPIG